MAEKSSTRSTGIREMWGIILLTFAVLAALALWSYKWSDIPLLCNPPNNPPENFIGLAGAWTAFLLIMTLGIGASLAPLLAAVLGLMLLVYPRTPFLPRCCWGLLTLLLSTAVLPLLPGVGDSLCLHWNIQGLSGGLFAWLLTDNFLRELLGYTGAAILIGGFLCAALVMFIGRAALTRMAHAVQTGGNLLLARYRAAQTARRSRLELLEREARALARRSEVLQKQLRRDTQQRPRPPETPPTAPQLPPETTSASEPVKPAAHTATMPPPQADAAKTATPDKPVQYQLPPISLLRQTPEGHDRQIDGDMHTTAKVLKDTLAEFGIECEVTNIEQGPVVTRYELLPAPGIRVENIAKLSNNLQLTLKATSIRVQAPIPGKGVVGIEVPNAIATKVYLRDILESESGRIRAAIPLVLGKDVGGSVLVSDLANMPHLLIAGATGSAKQSA